MRHDLPVFSNREEAGRRLAAMLRDAGPYAAPVVLGLARGGVVVAAQVARALACPLDAVAVRKVGHPFQPEYAIGAVAPGGVVYLRGPDGLRPHEVEAAVALASRGVAALDAELHGGHGAVGVSGATVVVVDDGLATGATMIAACRWARVHGASRVVAAAPVVAARSVGLLRSEANDVIALAEPDPFGAVGYWYRDFEPVSTGDVLQLLEQFREGNAGVTPRLAERKS